MTQKVLSCEIGMIPFVEGMYKSFEDRMTGRSGALPLEPKFTVSMADKTPVEESRAVLEAGYQCAMGMLLWAARRVYTACKVGVSVLCRVMSRPSWKVFYGAMQMLRWIYERRMQGIKFTQGVCILPLGFVDASNKPDPQDGKCQFGYVFMFMGGPIMELSKKLRHAGLSSEHNGYMALHFAHQALIWLRQLLEELGLFDLIDQPTVILEDNKAAILLSQEDMISTGNQYMYLPYHFNKEVQEEGFSGVRFVGTHDNIGDMLTKCNGTAEFKTLLGPLTGYDTQLLSRLFAGAYD